MLIPLGTDRPLRRPTVVTWVFIAATLAAFCGQVVTGFFFEQAAAVHPVDRFMLSRAGWREAWWTLITYAFLHGSWWHFAGNMLFLWVFGPNIEDRFGRAGFVVFYLLGAVAAGLVHIAVSPHPVLGASGAIAACTGAYLVMFPRTTVRAFSLLFVIGVISLPAWWFIGLSIVWDLVAGGAGARTGVAHAAHLGGYGFGAAVSFSLLGLKILQREPYDLFSMTRQAHRRHQIKAAVQGQQRRNEARWEKARAEPRNGSAASEESARAAALAEARAEVARLMASGQVASGAAAYKRLAEQFPVTGPGGGTALSRKNQYDLASHFYLNGDHDAAVYAYERFIEAYPRDPETPQIRLLLGRLNARYLNDPVRAKALITEAIKGLRDDESLAMARRELEALG